MESPEGLGSDASDRLALLAELYPTVVRNARTAAQPWAGLASAPFSSLPATLSWPASRLAARELLELLDGFQATQLASADLAAVPLVSACVLAAGGRYTGLLVRPERKSHGSGRRVEGTPDPAAKVAVVTNSFRSGDSFLEAARALEDEGLTVEGLVALVEFPYRGGRERVAGHGYRIETAFDLRRDLLPGPGAGIPGPVPASLTADSAQWSASRVPDGLNPAEAARAVAAHLARADEILSPPRCFDQVEDGRGGVWVSFRRRDDDRRLARKGFWHFDPGNAVATVDVVIATAMTVAACRPALRLDDLGKLKIAVTFFSPLEAVAPSALDFDRYGVVVRSRVFPAKVGGALPDTPAFITTFEQYLHARDTNAGIGPFEPHDVFRHTVAKRVEPGATWPSFGVSAAIGSPLPPDRDLGQRLASRVRSIIEDELSRAPSRPDCGETPAIGMNLSVLRHSSRPLTVVTLYDQGHPTSAVSAGLEIDESVAQAARSALALRKSANQYLALPSAPPQTFTVALLYEPQRLGVISHAAAARTIRAGRDSCLVQDGERSGLFIDALSCHQSWPKERATAELARLAGVSSPQASWTTFKTASWASRSGAVYPLRFGARQREPGEALSAADIALLAEHLHRRLDINGWPACAVLPASGTFARKGPAAWCVHSLQTLREAARLQGREDWRADANRGLAYASGHLIRNGLPALDVPGHRCGPMADAFILRALARAVNPALPVRSGLPSTDPATDLGFDALADMEILAGRISSWLMEDGSVLPEGVTRSRSDSDALPGIALIALASYGLSTARDVGVDWPRVIALYRNRFEMLHPWDLAAWHSQLWLLVSQLTGERWYAERAIEFVDWICQHQLDADGSFLSPTSDRQSGRPGSRVALLAEGIAAGWRWAVCAGDMVRCTRYRSSWHRAMTFLDRLVVRADDTYWMPEPGVAVGGVRSEQSSYDLRADSTSHTLSALIAGVAADGTCPGT